jgi:hypothetical protein
MQHTQRRALGATPLPAPRSLAHHSRSMDGCACSHSPRPPNTVSVLCWLTCPADNPAEAASPAANATSGPNMSGMFTSTCSVPWPSSITPALTNVRDPQPIGIPDSGRDTHGVEMVRASSGGAARGQPGSRPAGCTASYAHAHTPCSWHALNKALLALSELPI